MMSARSIEDWIAEYEQGHQQPMNRRCHTIGIPMITASILAIVPALFVHAVFWVAGGLFVVGWALQFVGHAYEGKPPEFFKDWRFLFVGLRWWFWKMSGRARRSGSERSPS